MNRSDKKINTTTQKLRGTSPKARVAVGMSGGVDSSVAAKLLLDQGYEVVGFMMKLWGEEDRCQIKDPSCFTSRDQGNACCDIEGLEDAKRVANQLGIPFYVVDARAKFKKEIVEYFINEYKNLRTPNPCVKCNEKIKFGWLLDFAEKVGCDYLATGHYARIAGNVKCQMSDVKNKGSFHLLRGKDEKKDQSYFLYRLTQDQLSKIIFPVGEFTKEEVRKMAKKWKLSVHEKAESQEICFVKDKNFRDFLHRYIPKNYYKPGEIVDCKGNVLGEHDGLINYTIGQRRGISQSGVGSRDSGEKNSKLQTPNSIPLYVIGFDVRKNHLIVGEDSDTYRNKMTIRDCHFINSKLKTQNSKLRNLTVKIRYRHPAVLCKLEVRSSKFEVRFYEPQRAITPGQSAVFYLDEEVLGGGIID